MIPGRNSGYPPFQRGPALSPAFPGPPNNFLGLFTGFCEEVSIVPAVS
jgi:hypothetical protein